MFYLSLRIKTMLFALISVILQLLITNTDTITHNFVAAQCAVQETYSGTTATSIVIPQNLDGCNIVIRNVVISDSNIQFIGRQITGNTNITVDGVVCETTTPEPCIFFNQSIAGAHTISIKNVRKHARTTISNSPDDTCEVYGVFFEGRDNVHEGIRHLEFENIFVSAHCYAKRSYVYGVRVQGPIGSVDRGSTLETFRASNIVVRDSVIMSFGSTDRSDDVRACALSLGGEIFASSSVNDSSSLQTSMLVENLLIDNVSMNATADLYANVFQILGLSDPYGIEDFTTVLFRNNSIISVTGNSTEGSADTRVINMWYARSINHKDVNATSTSASTFIVEGCSMRNVQSYYGKTSGSSSVALAIVDVRKDLTDFDQVVFKDLILDNVLIESASDWTSEIWGVRIYASLHGRRVVYEGNNNTSSSSSSTPAQQQLQARLPVKHLTFSNVRATNLFALGRRRAVIRLFFVWDYLHSFNQAEFSNARVSDVKLYGRESARIEVIYLRGIDDSISSISGNSNVNDIRTLVVNTITVENIVARSDEVVDADSRLVLFSTGNTLDAHLESLTFADLTIRNVDWTYIAKNGSYLTYDDSVSSIRTSQVMINLVRISGFSMDVRNRNPLSNYIRLSESSPQNVVFVCKNLLIENIFSNSIGATNMASVFFDGALNILTSEAAYKQHKNGALASPSSIRSFTFEDSTIRNIIFTAGRHVSHFYAMENVTGFNQITVKNVATKNTSFLRFEGSNDLRSDLDDSRGYASLFMVSVAGIDTQLMLLIEKGDATNATDVITTINSTSDFVPGSPSEMVAQNITFTDFTSTLIGMRGMHVNGLVFLIAMNGFRLISVKDMLISGIFFRHERMLNTSFFFDTGASVRGFVSIGLYLESPSNIDGGDIFQVENLTLSRVECHGRFLAVTISALFLDSVMTVGQSLSVKSTNVADVYIEESSLVQISGDFIAEVKFLVPPPLTTTTATLLHFSDAILRNITVVSSSFIRVSTVQTFVVNNVDTFDVQNIANDNIRVSYDNREHSTIFDWRSIEHSTFSAILLENIGAINFKNLVISNSIASFVETIVLNKNQYDAKNEKPEVDSDGFSVVSNVLVGVDRETRSNSARLLFNPLMSIKMPNPQGVVNCRNLVVEDVKMNNAYVATASASYTGAAANIWLMGQVQLTSSLVLSNAEIQSVIVKNTLGKAMMASLLLNDGQDGMLTNILRYEINNAKIEKNSFFTRDVKNGFAAIFGASSPLTDTISIKIQSSLFYMNPNNTDNERSSCATSPAVCSLARFSYQNQSSSSAPPSFEIDFSGNTMNVPSQEFSSFIVATDNFLKNVSMYSSVRLYFTKNTFAPFSGDDIPLRHYFLTLSKYEPTSPLLTTLSGSKWSFECDNDIANNVLRFFDRQYSTRNGVITHCVEPSYTKTYVKVPTKSPSTSKEVSITKSIIPPIPKWISPLRSASDGMLAATTIMQAFVSPTMVMETSRTRSALSIASRIADGECGFKEADLETELGFTSSPLRMRFPKEQGGTASGAVIGNFVFLIIAFLIPFGGYVAFQRFVKTRPRNPRTGERHPPPPLQECIFESRSITVLFTASMALLGPSLESAVLLVAIGSVPVLWKVVSVLIWFVMIVAAVFGFLVILRLIFQRRQIEIFVMRKSSSNNSHNNSNSNNNNINDNNKSEGSASAWASRLKWLLVALTLPQGEWNLPKRRNQVPGAKERDKYDHRPTRFSSADKNQFNYLLPFIKGYNDRSSINRRFFLVDLTATVILSFCNFAGSKEHLGCMIMAIISCITFGLYGLITLFFRPSSRLIMKISNPLSSFQNLALVVLSLVGVEEQAFAGLMTFVAVTLLVLGTLSFVGFVLPKLEAVFDKVKNRVLSGSNNSGSSGGGSSGGSGRRSNDNNDNNNMGDISLNELLLMTPTMTTSDETRISSGGRRRHNNNNHNNRDDDELLGFQQSSIISSRRRYFDERPRSSSHRHNHHNHSSSRGVVGDSQNRRHRRHPDGEEDTRHHHRHLSSRPSSSSYRRREDSSSYDRKRDRSGEKRTSTVARSHNHVSIHDGNRHRRRDHEKDRSYNKNDLL